MTPKSDPSTPEALLKAAWQRQQAYSKNASRHQRRFVFLRTLLAFLSIVVVVLAVIEDNDFPGYWGPVIDNSLRILPIAITALVAFSIRFDRGQNWILLRGGAEALKTEIYRYRTGVAPYNTPKRGVVLSEKLQQLSGGLKGSPVHHGAMAPYEHEITPYETNPPSRRTGLLLRLIDGGAKGCSNLSKGLWNFLFKVDDFSGPEDNKYDNLIDPNDYVKFRLETQFEWYRKQAKYLARQLQLFQTGVYVFGGVGTLLAAFDQSRGWVAVTTALVGGCTNYLEVKRTESSLVGYNQAADTLYDIRTWWYSLPPKEQDKPAQFKRLVDSCEDTIRSETTSWLQDMQDRLTQLYGGIDDDNGEEKETQ